MQLNPSFRDRILLGTNAGAGDVQGEFSNVVKQNKGQVQVLDGLGDVAPVLAPDQMTAVQAAILNPPSPSLSPLLMIGGGFLLLMFLAKR